MSLLFTRKPIVVNSDLADRIGLNEAIVLQQVNYWITGSTAGEEYDGRKWVYNTFEKWQEENFPFWSVDTVKRTFTKLRKLGLVEVKQLRKSQHDHTNFYTINYENALLSDQGNLHQSKGAKCNDPSGQNAPAHQGNLPQSGGADCPNLHTETTSEITAETTAERSGVGASPPSPGKGSGVPAVIPKGKRPAAKPKQDEEETAFQAKCRAAWHSFKAAYLNRYRIAPVRDAKVSSQVKQLVKRLGEEAAPVAEFYVLSVNDAMIVKNCHDFGYLLKGAMAYRTQWATGRAITSGQARQIDSTQTNANAAEQAKVMLRAQHEREQREKGGGS